MTDFKPAFSKAHALQVALLALLLGSRPAAAASPRTDTWFESTENSSTLLALAERVGTQEVYTSHAASQACSRENYLRTLRETQIEWHDFQVSGERLVCDPSASRPGEEASYCYYPKGKLLRMSLGAWSAARTDAERLQLAAEALLEACGPGQPTLQQGSKELIESLRTQLQNSDAEGDTLDRVGSAPEKSGLIQVPSSHWSHASFGKDKHGNYLHFNMIQAGGGVALSDANRASGLGYAGPVGSLLAHGIIGHTANTGGGFVLTYLTRGTFMGAEKPVYRFSTDTTLGMFPGVGLWIGIEANKLPQWKTGEKFLRSGIELSPVFIKLGEKSYFLFQVAGSFSSWRMPGTDFAGKDLEGKVALGGVASVVARLGDFLVTAGGYFDAYVDKGNFDGAKGGPSRNGAEVSVSIPVRLLLSNEFLRIEAVCTAIKAGDVYHDAGDYEASLPASSNTTLNLLYEARF